LPAYSGNDVVEDEYLEPPREVVIIFKAAMDDIRDLNKKPAAEKTGGKISVSIVCISIIEKNFFFLTCRKTIRKYRR
jgi:hypothetical protein